VSVGYDCREWLWQIVRQTTGKLSQQRHAHQMRDFLPLHVGVSFRHPA
jgi:hypothetical protein